MTAAGTRVVLVVDDEMAIRESLKAVLELSGYTVYTAADGAQALPLCRSHAQSLDAVLLDVTVVGMSSSEILDNVRRIAGDVPVILLSGFSEAQMQQRFQLSGYSAYLKKPYSIAELLGALNFPR